MSGRFSRRLDVAFGGWRSQGKPVPSCGMSVAISARHCDRRPGHGHSLSVNVEQGERLSHSGCEDECAQGLMRRNRGRGLGVRLIACRQSGQGCRQAFATTRRVLLNGRGRGMLRRAGLRGCVDRAGLFQHGLGQDAQVFAQAFHAAHQ